MADRFLYTLAMIILVLIGILLSSSALTLVVDLNAHLIEVVGLYVGGALIFLSLVMAGSNLILTRHALQEYWLLVAAGSIIGVLYVT